MGQPTITSPLQNSLLCDSTIHFEWTPNGTKVDEWELVVGPYPNHDYAFDNNNGPVKNQAAIAP